MMLFDRNDLNIQINLDCTKSSSSRMIDNLILPFKHTYFYVVQ